MEPWGHEPLGRAEAAEKADEKVQTRRGRSHGAPWGGRAEGAGTIWSAMEREGRMGRSGRGRKGRTERRGREGGEGGHALGPFKVS